MRIPLIVSSLGASGYGLLLAITAFNPWLLLLIAGLTNLTRVGVAEALGAPVLAAAWDRLETLRVRAYIVAGLVLIVSVAMAGLVPWGTLYSAPAEQRLHGISGSASAWQGPWPPQRRLELCTWDCFMPQARLPSPRYSPESQPSFHWLQRLAPHPRRRR